jgi:hypothetical protein
MLGIATAFLALYLEHAGNHQHLAQSLELALDGGPFSMWRCSDLYGLGLRLSSWVACVAALFLLAEGIVGKHGVVQRSTQEEIRERSSQQSALGLNCRCTTRTTVKYLPESWKPTTLCCLQQALQR